MAYYSSKKREFVKELLEKYPHLKDDEEFLMEYCESKVTPADENPDVEKLIEEHEARND